MYIIYCHHANRQKGNPPSQQDDITDLGVQDAKLFGELLKKSTDKVKVKAIYTSEFLRCTKTADLINQHIKAPVIVDARLNEHGSNFGESWLDTQTRITRLLDEIIDQYEDKDYVICVTSGVNIAPFISKAYGLQPTPNTPYLGVPTCSPIIFEYKKHLGENK